MIIELEVADGVRKGRPYAVGQHSGRTVIVLSHKGKAQAIWKDIAFSDLSEESVAEWGGLPSANLRWCSNHNMLHDWIKEYCEIQQVVARIPAVHRSFALNLFAAIAEAALQRTITSTTNSDTGFANGVITKLLDNKLGRNTVRGVSEVSKGAAWLVESIQQRSVPTAHDDGQPLTSRLDHVKTIQVHYWCSISNAKEIAVTHITKPLSTLLPSRAQQHHIINIGVAHRQGNSNMGGAMITVPFAFVPRPTIVGGKDELAV